MVTAGFIFAPAENAICRKPERQRQIPGAQKTGQENFSIWKIFGRQISVSPQENGKFRD